MLLEQRFNEILLTGPIQNGVSKVGVVLDSVYHHTILITGNHSVT